MVVDMILNLDIRRNIEQINPRSRFEAGGIKSDGSYRPGRSVGSVRRSSCWLSAEKPIVAVKQVQVHIFERVDLKT